MNQDKNSASEKIISAAPAIQVYGMSAAGALCLTSLSISGDAKDSMSILYISGTMMYVSIHLINWYLFLYAASFIVKYSFNYIANRGHGVEYFFAATSAFLIFTFFVASFVAISLLKTTLVETWDVVLCESKIKPFYSDKANEDIFCKKIVDALSSATKSDDKKSDVSQDTLEYAVWGFISFMFVVIVIMWTTGFGSSAPQGNGDAPMTGACSQINKT